MINRNKGLDVARGLVMFYIITIIHGVYWLGIFESDLSSLLLFEMPLIFMISGYAYAITKGGIILCPFFDQIVFPP
jgi:fucose 4-O-acetylase-like acetyltransferase